MKAVSRDGTVAGRRGVAARYLVECRPLSDPQGPWTQDGMGDPAHYTFASRELAERCAADLPSCGPDWAEYEYRVREVES